jgi:hypothetical protein
LTLHEEEFGIQETLRTLLAQYETKAKTKGIELSLDVSTVHRMWVKGDRQRLVQILKNLLENALKFTPSGGIQLRAQSVGGGVLFEVQDSGIGIAVDRQQQIFNSFEHADVQTNRQYGGTGLGLAICERLVKLQGGIIGVSSVLGQGSRFWFQLPLKSLAARQGQVAGELASALANQTLRILLVDDGMTTGATLNECARILKIHGANTVTVAVAARTLFKLEQDGYNKCFTGSGLNRAELRACAAGEESPAAGRHCRPDTGPPRFGRPFLFQFSAAIASPRRAHPLRALP